MKKLITSSIILLSTLSLFAQSNKEIVELKEKIRREVEIQFLTKQYEDSKKHTSTFIMDNYIRQLKRSIEEADKLIKAQKEYIEKYRRY